MAAWLLAWSTAVSPLLLPTRTRNQRFDLSNHPLLVNTIFCGFPLVFFVCLVTLATLAQREYAQYWASYQLLLAYLTPLTIDSALDAVLLQVISFLSYNLQSILKARY